MEFSQENFKRLPANKDTCYLQQYQLLLWPVQVCSKLCSQAKLFHFFVS